MSMAAGFTFPDGVVLVADGMVATFTKGETEPTALNPDVNKIERVTDSIYAVRFGVEAIAGEIIDRLRGGVYLSPGHVRDRLRAATAEVWAPAESMALERVGDAGGVGVLVGGLAGGEPFVSSVLRHPVEGAKDDHRDESWVPWFCGADSDEEVERFFRATERAARLTFGRFGWPPFAGPINEVILHVLGAMVKTMQDIAEDRPLSGGTFRCVVVRKGYEPLEQCVAVTPGAGPGVSAVHFGVLDEEETEPDPVDAVRVATMTGIVIRTAASGARVCIAPSDGGSTHVGNWYDSSGVLLLLTSESVSS